MNAASLIRTPASRVAFAALVVALGVVAWTLVNALRMEPVPDSPPAALASLETITHHTSRPVTDVQAAVESDVFSPDRTAPAASYRLPGEANPNDKQVELQKPVVLGTGVVTEGRSFAMVQAAGEPRPTLVHVGDKIGGWLVRTIERGKVTFVSTGGVRADVAAPKPGI